MAKRKQAGKARPSPREGAQQAEHGPKGRPRGNETVIGGETVVEAIGTGDAYRIARRTFELVLGLVKAFDDPWGIAGAMNDLLLSEGAESDDPELIKRLPGLLEGIARMRPRLLESPAGSLTTALLKAASLWAGNGGDVTQILREVLDGQNKAQAALLTSSSKTKDTRSMEQDASRQTSRAKGIHLPPVPDLPEHVRAFQDRVESITLALVETLASSPDGSLSDRYPRLHSRLLTVLDDVRQIAASILEPSLNEVVKAHPKDQYEDKQALCHWVTSQLSPLGLAVEDPTTKRPSHLVAVKDEDRPQGRFTFQYKQGEKWKKSYLPVNSPLPHLRLVLAAA